MQTHVDDEKMAVSSFLLEQGRADEKVVFLYKLIAGVAESSHGTRKLIKPLSPEDQLTSQTSHTWQVYPPRSSLEPRQSLQSSSRLSKISSMPNDGPRYLCRLMRISYISSMSLLERTT